MFFINTIFALGVIFLLLSIINSFSNIFYDMIQSDAKSKRLKQMKSVKQNKNLELIKKNSKNIYPLWMMMNFVKLKN